MLRDGIRDDQWDRIKDLLPGRIGHVGATARNNRLFIDAVLYRIRTGIPWRDLPERFGDFKNIHRRFSRWAEKGLWTNLLSLLTEDADEEYVMIDSTLVRAHQHSSGAVGRNPSDQAIGRSRGGLTTKIHARVDALGNPATSRRSRSSPPTSPRTRGRRTSCRAPSTPRCAPDARSARAAGRASRPRRVTATRARACAGSPRPAAPPGTTPP